MLSLQKYQSVVSILNRFHYFFLWLKLFYPRAQGIPLTYQLYCFFPQKVLRVNGAVPWPVHFTSRVLWHSNISVGYCCSPGLSGCCYIQARNRIIIGNNFRMGPGCGLISANHHPDDYDQHTVDPPIEIGNNVWLGMNVVVLPGVKIGDNVIVAANSVVSDNIPSNVIAGGTPCRILKEKTEYKGRQATQQL